MMILSQYHIFELDTINIYSADNGEASKIPSIYLTKVVIYKLL